MNPHSYSGRLLHADLSPRRCPVITPSGVTTSATRLNRYFQYPQEFENAPLVRPGLYRFQADWSYPGYLTEALGRRDLKVFVIIEFRVRVRW